jgi:DNA repair protein RadC
MNEPKPVFRVRELELKYSSQRLGSPCTDRLTTSSAVAQLATEMLRDAATEIVLVLHLNFRHKLIGTHRIVGTLDSVVVNPGDICRMALLSNATSVVLVHNHLSGDPNPSAEDRQLVERLGDALGVLNIGLFDAMIVVDPSEGEQRYSFRDSGDLED